MIADFIGRLGPLRTMLAVLLAVLIVMAPFTAEHAGGSTWGILTSMIAPALVPIAALVVMFDAVMARIVMTGEDRSKRYGTVLWTYGVLTAVLVAVWAPFYARLF